jgi:hypothetical protein
MSVWKNLQDAVSQAEHPDAFSPRDMQVSFEGQEVTVHLVAGEFGSLIISVEGLREQCMVLRVQKAHANLDLVQTHKNECPPPLTRGKFIMQLVDTLCENLLIKNVQLIDASELYIEGLRIKLTFLRTMLHGRGWYESFGYRIVGPDYETYRASISACRNTPLEEVCQKLRFNVDIAQLEEAALQNILQNFRLANLPKIRKRRILSVKDFYNAWEARRAMLESYCKKKELLGKLVSDLFSWLWKEALYEDFLKVQEFLYPETIHEKASIKNGLHLPAFPKFFAESWEKHYE